MHKRNRKKKSDKPWIKSAYNMKYSESGRLLILFIQTKQKIHINELIEKDFDDYFCCLWHIHLKSLIENLSIQIFHEHTS